MNFGNNLQILRKKNNISQEELAATLEISRQAISKWESGTGYPEMEKLLQISELFHCSVDDLLKGKVEVDIDLKDKATREFQSFGKAITIGTMLLIIGCSLFCFFPMLKELVLILFFLIVTVSVGLFIYFGIMHDHFVQTYDLESLYTKEEMDAFQKKFSIGIVIGVTVILLGLVVFFGLNYLLPNGEIYKSIGAGTFLCFVAISMPFLVYNGIQQSKFELVTKNQFSKDLDVNYRKQVEKGEEIIGKFSGVIMLTATLVYLYFGFTKNAWGTMWYVFPIGGILCGIVAVIFGKEN